LNPFLGLADNSFRSPDRTLKKRSFLIKNDQFHEIDTFAGTGPKAMFRSGLAKFDRFAGTALISAMLTRDKTDKGCRGSPFKINQ